MSQNQKIPFLYVVDKDDEIKYLVVIASHQFEQIDLDHLNRPELPEDAVWQPCIQNIHEIHTYDNKNKALKFIKDWWANKEICLV